MIASSTRGQAVVVGAGLAGLTAACELAQAGWAVTLLEARDRVGGRVHTMRQGFSGGQYAEGGGEFIDSVHSQMRHYAQRFGLAVAEVGRDGDRSLLYLNQRRFLWRDLDTAVLAGVERFWQVATELGQQVDAVAPAAGLDQQSMADLLEQLDLEPTARFLVENHIRSEYTVEPADLSSLSFIRDVAAYATVPDEAIEAYRICGGNSQLPQALAAAFASGPECKLIVNAPLTAVRLTADAVTMSHAQGNATADYAVIATPLPPLRHVTFTPPLPTQLAAAINHLGYGAVTKIMLQYERRFWRDGGANGRLITDLPIGSVYEATDQQEGKAGILTVYVAGKFDALFRHQEEAAQLETAAAQLEVVYPGSRHLLQAGRAISWAREEYNGGSYSALKPGQALTLGRSSWDGVGENGRLYFAGEHTDTLYAAYMEGAVRSGQRVAGKIVA